MGTVLGDDWFSEIILFCSREEKKRNVEKKLIRNAEKDQVTPTGKLGSR